jgi:Transglycosylase SLT domain
MTVYRLNFGERKHRLLPVKAGVRTLSGGYAGWLYGLVAPGCFLIFSMPGAFADCLDDAAAYHGVPPVLARAIAMQESGMHPETVSRRNTNGTYDIGLMQINSAWLPLLAHYGISESALHDACVNAYVGTWILQQDIARYGVTWEAVGAYNAASPSKRELYATAIYRQLHGLLSAPQLPTVAGSPLAAGVGVSGPAATPDAAAGTGSTGKASGDGDE